MKIIYISQFDDNCGYGSAARGYLQSLDSALNKDIELKIYSVSLESKMSLLSEEEKRLLQKYKLKDRKEIESFLKDDFCTVIWHMPPPMLEIIYQNSNNTILEKENKWHNCKYIFDNCSKNINISAWEADRIPNSWKDIFEKRKTSLVIVPSKWNKEVYKKSIKNVEVVPHLIRHPSEKSVPINLPLDIRNKFIIFSMSQWDLRKGFDALIKSYLMEFKNQEDVILLIKTYGIIVDSMSHLQEQQKANILSEIKNYKNSIFLDRDRKPSAKIIPIIGPIDYEKINYLYDISSCFALATRGEGFGLTIAEAYLKNKNIIVPKEGGHLDYLENDENIKYFDGYWSPYCYKPGYDCDMNWYEPNILSIRKMLRESYQDWKLGKQDIKKQRKTLNKEEIGSIMFQAITRDNNEFV